MPGRKSPAQNVTAVDLFCGAGGLTRGLLDAEIQVTAGYDIDPACQFPHEHNNHPARFHRESVTDITGRQLAAHYPSGHIKVLVGCAPCQTFCKYTQGLDNENGPILDFQTRSKEVEGYFRFVLRLAKQEVALQTNDGTGGYPNKPPLYCPRC